MEIRSEARIRHPREKVFAAYRDRLPEVARYLPDIKEIVQNSRSEEGSTIKLHNVWVSDREIPSMAATLIRPEHLRWDDFAVWNGDTFVCDWRIKTRAFTDGVDCAGTNTFLDDGQGGTRVILSGHFKMDVKSIPGVPSFLAGKLAPKVESFIVGLITPNLEKTNQAVERYLDDNS